MTPRAFTLGGVLALASTSLLAHPHSDVDQQVALTLAPDHIAAEVLIVPSVTAGPDILSRIDSDGNGTLSAQESEAFARDVLQQSSLSVGGSAAALELTEVFVSEPEALQAGLGAIVISARTEASTPNATLGTVGLEMRFQEFSHDWFIQPYLQSGTIEAASVTIDRAETGAILISLE